MEIFIFYISTVILSFTLLSYLSINDFGYITLSDLIFVFFISLFGPITVIMAIPMVIMVIFFEKISWDGIFYKITNRKIYLDKIIFLKK